MYIYENATMSYALIDAMLDGVPFSRVVWRHALLRWVEERNPLTW